MTNEEELLLEEKYFIKDGFQFPEGFEYRLDKDSLKAIYSFIREWKPKNVLEIGTSHGGSTITILGALLANAKPFNFVASELLDALKAEAEQHCMEKFGTAPTMIGDVTKNLDKVPEKIDFLMHDDDHDLETTQWVIDNIFPRLNQGALVIFHDWAVEEVNGKWFGKGSGGLGAWPETQLLMDLHEQGKLPLKKVYWNYHNPGNWETGVFTYEPR